MTLINLAEYEEAARAKLRREAYDYYAGGANDEVTLRANREAYGRLALYHRVLRDVAVRDTWVEMVGDRISLPEVVAPTACQRMACDEGECATDWAAGGRGGGVPGAGAHRRHGGVGTA